MKARLTVDAKSGALKIEARNDGVREFLQVGATEHSVELEVDGKWYRWEPAKGGDQLLGFGLGATLKGCGGDVDGELGGKEERRGRCMSGWPVMWT